MKNPLSTLFWITTLKSCCAPINNLWDQRHISLFFNVKIRSSFLLLKQKMMCAYFKKQKDVNVEDITTGQQVVY